MIAVTDVLLANIHYRKCLQLWSLEPVTTASSRILATNNCKDSCYTQRLQQEWVRIRWCRTLPDRRCDKFCPERKKKDTDETTCTDDGCGGAGQKVSGGAVWCTRCGCNDMLSQAGRCTFATQASPPNSVPPKAWNNNQQIRSLK